MVDLSSPTTGPLQEVRRPKTAAERQRAYRQRQRQKRQVAPHLDQLDNLEAARPGDHPVTAAIELPVASDLTATTLAPGASPITRDVTPVTFGVTSPSRPIVTHITQSQRHVTSGTINSYGLTAAALALAITGLIMNGWYARSLGSTDLAGWLFLAIGAASDLVALAVPSAATRLWQTRARVRAGVAWLVWCMTFVFALISGVGFASVNIADATLVRASRVTPVVTMAQDALRDAVASRNRECAGGVGRFCREREQAVTERQRAVDSALSSIQQTADPQIEAVSKIAAWLTAGTATPSAEGFAMLRLMLMALLPQIGGILLMIGRPR